MTTFEDYYLTDDACVDSPQENCRGSVGYRCVPNGAPVARCVRHFDERLARYDDSLERYADSDVAPSWFDHTACGERWDDGY